MKHLKMFEDFQDSSSAKANDLLKQIDKTIRYNLKFGTLSKKGFVYDNSDIFDDKGPYDWLKMEFYIEKEKSEYRYNVLFMIDEEYLAAGSKEGEEKLYLEIYKYKLPEYKKIASVKKTVDLKNVFEDEFLFKEIEEADKKVLKVPHNQEEYLKNLKNQETKSDHSGQEIEK